MDAVNHYFRKNLSENEKIFTKQINPVVMSHSVLSLHKDAIEERFGNIIQ